MTYTTEGKIFLIGNITTINNSLKKREVVIVRNDGGDSAYPNMVLELLNADTAKTDGLKVGDHVSVSFAIHGRAYNPPKGGGTRYFNNIRLLDIELTPNGDGGEGTVSGSLTPEPVTAFDDMPDIN